MRARTRVVLLIAGWACVALGTIGVFVPVLPTTPFLLLAAACFFRSSERAHRWLLEHPVLGLYVRDYLAGRGVPWRVKAVALVLLWATISLAAWFFVPWLAVDVVLFIVAVGVTMHLLAIGSPD